MIQSPIGGASPASLAASGSSKSRSGRRDSRARAAAHMLPVIEWLPWARAVIMLAEGIAGVPVGIVDSRAAVDVTTAATPRKTEVPRLR